ncbi:MAG TPA: integrase arm-type DNA-binding domain-containing protein, partial [Steroidobacteraceae bacterium]|nr:integrase arm-type DNA-binding domain-containing protein [Steroidobacteraceae bacterium]
MLSETEIRNAKPRERDYKLYDRRGLYLSVVSTGSKLWRFRYSYGGKEKLLALGRYEQVSLKKARDMADQARGLLAGGVDPSTDQRRDDHDDAAQRAPPGAARTFETVAREWWAARKESERWDEDYALQIMRQFERDVFPIKLTRGLTAEDRASDPLVGRPFGQWPIEAIMPPDVLEICQNVEARGSLDTARDLRSRLGMVYQREQVLGRCASNPAENVIALLAKPHRTNHATITYDELPAFFVRLDAEDLQPTTRLGLEAIIATWLRSTELRLAQWPWLDWKARELRIPSPSMKNGDKGKGDHIVPL